MPMHYLQVAADPLGVVAAKSVGENIAMWLQAVGAVLALVVAGLALWFNVMPWCDMSEVDIAWRAGNVKLTSRVRNTGRGQAFDVRIWLLEYGSIVNIKDAQGYIGALSPGTELTPPYESAEIDLGGIAPPNAPYRVLLTWDAWFWTGGEAYVEQRYHDGLGLRPRVKLIYPWTRLCRRLTKYDVRGRG
jgi:hypothetical protein